MSFLAKFKHKFRATDINAGWSSPVARQAHNLKVAGSNPAPATKKFHIINHLQKSLLFLDRRIFVFMGIVLSHLLSLAVRLIPFYFKYCYL